MRILIIGDTHAQDDVFLRVLAKEREFDALLHTGDFEGSELVYRELVDVPFYYIAGNNDFFSMLPKERQFSYGGKKFFVTHGHYYSVASGYHRVLEEAKSRGCDFAIYGHTHVPEYHFKDGVHVINPGSLGFPRQFGRKYTYAIINIDSAGDVKVELKEMDEE